MQKQKILTVFNNVVLTSLAGSSMILENHKLFIMAPSQITRIVKYLAFKQKQKISYVRKCFLLNKFITNSSDIKITNARNDIHSHLSTKLPSI